MKPIAQENIIELAKLGHERASELKASCGAVDVRSLAQLISDLASQLEMQYVRAEESQREFRSADITMQNLEAKLKQSKIDADCYKKGMEASNVRLVQLATESAGLKKALSTDSETMLLALDAFNTHGSTRPDVGLQQAINVVMQRRETPATDDFLAEVRAQGVDAAIEHLNKKFAGTGHIGVPVMSLEWLAQELRKGAAL
ncbi:hypothetical protein ACMGOC_003319 [Citrobacter freundii]